MKHPAHAPPKPLCGAPQHLQQTVPYDQLIQPAQQEKSLQHVPKLNLPNLVLDHSSTKIHKGMKSVCPTFAFVSSALPRQWYSNPNTEAPLPLPGPKNLPISKSSQFSYGLQILVQYFAALLI